MEGFGGISCVCRYVPWAEDGRVQGVHVGGSSSTGRPGGGVGVVTAEDFRRSAKAVARPLRTAVPSA